MLVAFANNQVIVAPTVDSVSIYTDPVPMGDFDRVSAMLNCHYLFPSGTVTYEAEVSNDGTNWAATALTDFATGATPTPRLKVEPVNGGFIRFKFTFANSGAVTGGVCFDLHVQLDHA